MKLRNMVPEDQEAAKNEAKYMEALDHPNIVSFKEVYLNKKRELNIIMEYCDGGNLDEFLETQKQLNKGKSKPLYMPQDKIMFYFTQVALGLKHMHDRKLLHRDIKPDNIFRTSRDFLRIGDFGISKVLACTKAMVYSKAGTPFYMAPELFKGIPYSFKADIWSLGILLFEMCALDYPFGP